MPHTALSQLRRGEEQRCQRGRGRLRLALLRFQRRTEPAEEGAAVAVAAGELLRPERGGALVHEVPVTVEAKTRDGRGKVLPARLGRECGMGLEGGVKLGELAGVVGGVREELRKGERRVVGGKEDVRVEREEEGEREAQALDARAGNSSGNGGSVLG